jgi:uncharacterized protein (UPF0332 family)
MSKVPPVDEREFMKIVRNHGELCRGLRTLDLAAASSDVADHAHHVGLCWLRLASEHLDDAKSALVSGRVRSTYSRSYYAAYNASKTIRYVVEGAVSLKGDDHNRAPDLPDDFPDVDRWAAAITNLYEHRLKADYDNWTSTRAELSLTPEETVALAEEFIANSLNYLEGKYGIKP